MSERSNIYLVLSLPFGYTWLMFYKKVKEVSVLEKQLHEDYKRSRFRMTNKVFFGKWFQMHIKIGRAKNVQSRYNQIAKDKTGSGSTEWFAMGLIELFCVICNIYEYENKITYFLFWVVVTTIFLIWYSGADLPEHFALN